MKKDALISQLKQYQDPLLGQDLVSARALKRVCVEGRKAVLDIELGFPVTGIEADMKAAIQDTVLALPEIDRVEVNISWNIAAHAVQPGQTALKGVKNVIAVASGKGGVGKSTTTVNLALALAEAGARVGVLDADIYGPNQPHMLGVTSKPTIEPDKKFHPIIQHGIQSMSIGYLIDANQPMVWRGPMVSRALQQLVHDTLWQDLDYLFIDLPPGTGDIQLTLAQKVPVSGAIIVTTPQDIALLDARKGLEMFNKVNVSVLGIVENMSTHVCAQCGHEAAIFGSGGPEKMAAECDVPLLGQLPLELQIREDADRGRPNVIAHPQGPAAKEYRRIARRLAAILSLKKINYTGKFPKIVVE